MACGRNPNQINSGVVSLGFGGWKGTLLRLVGNMEIAGMQNVKVVIDGNRPWQKKQSNVQAE
jgi:hypothetical protein